MLEDRASDAELALRELRDSGLAVNRRIVQTEAAFRDALQDFAPNLILADYHLPSFSGLDGLAIVQRFCPDVPFIFLTGTIGEEKAVALIKAGATDCVLKDRLSLLGPAVQRALREAGQKTQTRLATEALREQERFAKAVLNSLNAKVAVLDKAGTILMLNAAWEKFSRANRNTCFARSGVGLNYLEIVQRAEDEWSEGSEEALAGIRAVLNGSRGEFTLEYPCHASGEKRWFLLSVSPLFTAEAGAVIAHLDITERKRAEEERRELQARLRQAEKLASIGELAASVARDLNAANGLGLRSGAEVSANLNQLLQRYEALLQAARGSMVTPELAAQAEATRAQVSEQVVLNLCKLLVALSEFEGEAKLPPPPTSESGSDQHQKLVSALQETIEVLTRTKRSFKSKALAQLRLKLETWSR